MNKLIAELGCLLLVMSIEAVPIYDDFNDGVINPEWNVGQDGWVTEAGGELRIQGTTAVNDWQGYGMSIPTDITGGSFDASVDFTMPQFSGYAHKLVYLGAKGSTSDEVGLFYSHAAGYRVQTWTPSQFSTWLYPFGDETSAFHRMRLMYDADAELLKGYVDDAYVGELSIQITGDISFSLHVVTSGPDMEIDVRYDNFQVIPEPATMALMGLFTAGIWIKRRFFIG
jgi:hypothetical protein